MGSFTGSKSELQIDVPLTIWLTSNSRFKIEIKTMAQWIDFYNLKLIFICALIILNYQRASLQSPMSCCSFFFLLLSMKHRYVLHVNCKQFIDVGHFSHCSILISKSKGHVPGVVFICIKTVDCLLHLLGNIIIVEAITAAGSDKHCSRGMSVIIIYLVWTSWGLCMKPT